MLEGALSYNPPAWQDPSLISESRRFLEDASGVRRFDLKNKSQVNLSTGTVRSIRRRCFPHLLVENRQKIVRNIYDVLKVRPEAAALAFQDVWEKAAGFEARIASATVFDAGNYKSKIEKKIRKLKSHNNMLDDSNSNSNSNTKPKSVERAGPFYGAAEFARAQQQPKASKTNKQIQSVLPLPLPAALAAQLAATPGPFSMRLASPSRPSFTSPEHNADYDNDLGIFDADFQGFF